MEEKSLEEKVVRGVGTGLLVGGGAMFTLGLMGTIPVLASIASVEETVGAITCLLGGAGIGLYGGHLKSYITEKISSVVPSKSLPIARSYEYEV